MNWDFKNKEINSKNYLINRQKSALNLEIIEIDKQNKIATFYDKKNGKIKSNIEECECYDFNYVGNSPRKNFIPCMHIYRLAIEVGLMEAKYFDKKALEDDSILRNLPKDTSQWGKWDSRIHMPTSQKNRQYRAYDIFNDNQDVNFEEKTGTINDYKTSLSTCTCPDFKNRQLPCKHIYCLALLLKISLKLSFEDFQKQKKEFEESFTPVISIEIPKSKFKFWQIKTHIKELINKFKRN